jgi:hypothetical protein
MSAQVCTECTAAYSVDAPKCPQCGASNPSSDSAARSGRAVTVHCPGQECPAYGVRSVVTHRLAAPGVVERPALHCTECDRALATVTGEEEDTDMAKITVHGGASNAAADEPEEGEDVSAGTSSSTSSEKESSSPEQSEKPDESPAPTTASRSGKGRTGKSTARGTDGGQTEATSETGSTDDEEA